MRARIAGGVHDALAGGDGAHRHHADQLDAQVGRPTVNDLRRYSEYHEYPVRQEDTDQCRSVMNMPGRPQMPAARPGWPWLHPGRRRNGPPWPPCPVKTPVMSELTTRMAMAETPTPAIEAAPRRPIHIMSMVGPSMLSMLPTNIGQ